jgi:hypothetical protein
MCASAEIPAEVPSDSLAVMIPDTLAIVQAPVQAHGGLVRAESAGLGAGARFVVTLPADGTSPGAR